MKYLVGEILLNDQDGEVEIAVVDKTQSIEDFFHFPPISKYAGDERILFPSIINWRDLDVIIHNHNFIEDTQDFFDELEEIKYTGRIIVISSWEVYGWKGRRQVPFDEIETKLEPTTQLGLTKSEIEKIALSHKDLDVLILRLSHIFGPYMPEDSELLAWFRSLLTQKSILVEQPAARAYDLCYVTNILAPIQKAFNTELPQKHTIINLGSADSDFKKVREKGKDVEKPQIFEKHVVEALVGLRVLLDSQSKIEVSNENISQFQGKGYHSQLKTERARKLLDYYPLVDTMKGCLQTAFWLQRSMDSSEAALGRRIEDIYPTLDDSKMLKVGETFQSTETEAVATQEKGIAYERRKKKEKASREARTKANESFVCKLCDHAPTMTTPKKTNMDNQDEICGCDCHVPYIEGVPS